ncbi:DUF2635 domain-containing protein [Pseudomonas sp. 10B1]|uniref:DUF2635 domain-containing protein n=1 Tax=unclassified Pseudomonas TaxID=196821 RepID=UPI002B22C15B|nr:MULTISPECIES: DUF2635 domain-containing protein [unclassified Pseudomonas]MEA9997053.1 DUF2635 domain-containing protein [Pseudomonas sp. AA4]MEB0089243.1 DUF2635 domain-containing protein [Pseudomonas sp. RTI1]MEB0128435.1 DUF2635 domain-containing protein [Pseudomonas sp. CCC1.2]MEB0155333.1 DUF2635 domain-containing protein [Pseudomonas sp. CCC4.3]MEB0221701.1 DUF2635 domain-containing protein [Pseudomonas sp. AB12(2023)]
MHVYPSQGLLVRDPVKQDFLPVEGREVPDSAFYWLRRLGCGDVTLTPPGIPVSVTIVPEPRITKTTTSDGSDSQ